MNRCSYHDFVLAAVLADVQLAVNILCPFVDALPRLSFGQPDCNGDCNTAACTFYWMAKVLGYSPKAVQGHVPNGSMSNLKPHAWVTIKFKKQLFYFDPDLNRAYAGKTVRTASGWVTQGKYCGFKFRYGTPGTYKYMN